MRHHDSDEAEIMPDRESRKWLLIADALSNLARYYVTEDEYPDGPDALIRHTAQQYRQGLEAILGRAVLDDECYGELQQHAADLRRIVRFLR